jgi:TRAP-type mannitol/chloroaromatic compound transport system permease small subunit
LAINEQTFNADPLPVYPFKFIIPLAGALVLMQGLAEMLRCVVCLQTGEWTPRLKDAQESDVVVQQLASSESVDEEARRLAIEQSKGLKG